MTCDAHASNVEIQLTTNAKCSPAIGTNNGTVIINCTNKDLEKKFSQLPDLTNYNKSMTQLQSLSSEAKIMGNRLKNLKNNYSVNTSTINSLRNNLNRLEGEYLSLRKSNENLRTKLANTLANSPEITQEDINNSASRISHSIAESVVDQQLQKYSRTVIFDIDNKLTENRKEFGKLSQRVDALEHDVSFLMTQFLDGNLQNNEGFFGISIGGHYLTEDWQPSLDLEYELLLPKFKIIDSHGSILIDLTWIDWKESQSFQTLPGADPITVDINRSSALLSLGSRLFITNWTSNSHSYIGALFGHTISGEEDSYYYSLSLGIEYFLVSRRIAFELRWENFSDIEREVSTFNPLGNASTTKTSESESGYYAGLRISFR
jgi:regulator of replication initiation timing